VLVYKLFERLSYIMNGDQKQNLVQSVDECSKSWSFIRLL